MLQTHTVIDPKQTRVINEPDFCQFDTHFGINSCKKIVRTKSKYGWESHRVFHGFIQENKQNKFIDEVLILVMNMMKDLRVLKFLNIQERHEENSVVIYVV